MTERKSVNQQISEEEEKLNSKLQSLKAECQMNRVELELKKQELAKIIQEYEIILCKDVEVAISISQFEEVLNALRMKKNPSVRL